MNIVHWTVNIYDYESGYEDWRDDPRWDILTVAAMELFKPLTVDDHHELEPIVTCKACGDPIGPKAENPPDVCDAACWLASLA